jgi:hypothetical protein
MKSSSTMSTASARSSRRGFATCTASSSLGHSKRKQKTASKSFRPPCHISSKCLDYDLFSRHLTVYVNRSKVLSAIEYKYPPSLRIQQFHAILSTTGYYEWDRCTAEACSRHDYLGDHAREQFPLLSDSEQTPLCWPLPRIWGSLTRAMRIRVIL